MENYKEISESLAKFNNVALSKECWKVVLKGLDLPTKSPYFWKAFRKTFVKQGENKTKVYTLVDMDESKFQEIWDEYCTSNRASVKKAYDKKKRNEAFKKKTLELRNKIKPFYQNPDGTIVFVDSFYNKEYNW